MEKLTHQEEELMLIIYQTKRGIIRDFIEKMEPPYPPYTTVASIVKNLQKKGYVASRRIGNVYEYEPAIDEKEFKAGLLSGVVKNYFNNSYKGLVSFFAEKQDITAEELEEIIRLIEKK
jgi:BlaI family transcriptional regulator, penicillinase repressor